MKRLDKLGFFNMRGEGEETDGIIIIIYSC